MFLKIVVSLGVRPATIDRLQEDIWPANTSRTGKVVIIRAKSTKNSLYLLPYHRTGKNLPKFRISQVSMRQYFCSGYLVGAY